MENTILEVFKNKRILVTGHTGFKGAWLCLLLDKIGADVYGYALTPPTNPSLYEVANVEDHVTSYIGNVQDFSHFSKVIEEVQPDAIIHMAAQALVRESYLNPHETYLTNVIGTVNLLEAIRKVSSVKAVVNVTTDKCYKNNEWDWGYRETDEIEGYDPYSNSKGCSELVTSSFRNSFFNENTYDQHGVAIASARAGNVIGGGDWAKDRLIPDFIRAISHGEKIVLRNPKAIRPWQHVLEPLTGYLYLLSKLLTDGAKFGGGWNFGPNESEVKNVEWIVYNMCRFWGKEAVMEIKRDPNLHESKHLKLDCSKAISRLGWHQKWDIEKTLKSITDWHKAFSESRDMKLVCFDQIDDFLNQPYKPQYT